jgi:hypothetical protein
MNNYVNDFEIVASKAIYENREEFNTYIKLNRKIDAIKCLKEYTGGGLKESKDAIDKFWVGELRTYIIEDRKKKLENLAKKPLIEEIVINIKSVDIEKLQTRLMKLSVDDLLTIDDIFINDEK